MFLFSLQKESISPGCRKKMFTAIYTHFKTLLYTNLILTGMNNIFVDLLQFKPCHRCTDNEVTRSPLHKADRLEPSTHNVRKDHGHQGHDVSARDFIL